MEYQKRNQNKQISQGKTLNDPREFNRILMQYGGIFKSSIPEYAKTLATHKPIKNFSR